MKNLFPAFLILFVIGTATRAQEVKFGRIEPADLAATYYEKDSSAPAAVLYREVVVRYRYLDKIGFHLMTDVHERIKIYNPDGYKYATVTEGLFKTSGDSETLTGLKGATYNLVEGKVVEDKVKRSDTFSEEANDYYKREKFTMPNVQDGSVIEYSYTIDSPFALSIDEIKLQYDIPIVRQEIRIEVPEYYQFKPQVKGYLPINPTYRTELNRLNYNVKSVSSVGLQRQAGYSSGGMDYSVNITSFDMKDVPALREEPFVNDMDNYRSSVNYELLWVQYPGQARENYSNTWEKVIDRINDNDRFGQQLSRTNYFSDDLAALVTADMDAARKMEVLFRHVQEHMTWNKLNGFITDKGVRKAYDDRSGNVGDINLMLIAMLREAGLTVNPVLVSTRDNGVPIFPTREGFNYVIAQVMLEGGYVLLDATDKHAEPNVLPVRALNWFGRAIDESGTYPSLSVFPQSPAKTTRMANLTLDAEGNLAGQLRSVYTDHHSYNFRSRYADMPEAEYLEGFQNRHEGLEITAYERNISADAGKPVMETVEFTLEDRLAVVGDRLFLNPLVLYRMKANPFKLETREYPIDYAYPWQEKITFNIALPEGYQITSLPEPAALSLAGDLGSFRYMLADHGNMLQVVVQVALNQAVIPAEYYAGIREFFDNIVQKESEQVVLTKIGGNGSKKSATGGR